MKRKRKPSRGSSDNGDKYLPQIGVRLPRDQVDALDALADKSRGRLNRSDLIRQAIDDFLKKS
jgi:metal-responsive CopG/Arc/MetJ family transcriptional regulator